MRGLDVEFASTIQRQHAQPCSASKNAVSDTVAVTVSHHLGKVEAIRRLKDGFVRTHGDLGPMIAIEQQTWEGDTVRFRIHALGQSALTTIEVLEDALLIEVALPWLLAKAAKRLLPMLQKQASLLLESYAWRLVLPLAGALVAESRMPRTGWPGCSSS